MDDIGLYANRTESKDFVQNAIERLADDGCNAYIAVAFFTEASVVETLTASGCHVRLVFRLGFPTNPSALQKLMGLPNVEIRYFTGHSFHPKIYIFGEKAALVGSANLTRAALLWNQEVVVSVDSSDQRLTELAALFSGYWREARVLDQATLTEYRAIFQEGEAHQTAIAKLGEKLLERFGESQPSNITRGKTKLSEESIFLEGYRRTYQECVSAFHIVRETYEASGYRKVSPSMIPLRLEIDSFISFVRERKAEGEVWALGPLRSTSEQRTFIATLIDEWRVTNWPHFEDDIVRHNYPRLLRTFNSVKSVIAASDDELFDALSTLHSFYDRFRFHLDGLPTWKRTFLAANDPKRVRDVLSYLVFGGDAIESRMANVIYDPSMKLSEFGRANVQELIGWCNKGELPIVNGRTTKVLRFFGSDVRQL
jgi:HKD family nuclease